MFQEFFQRIKEFFLPHEPQGFGTKRRLEESEANLHFRKIRRLDDIPMAENHVLYTSSLKSSAFKIPSHSKENVIVIEDDDDECCVVADYSKKEWKTPSPRKAIRRPVECVTSHTSQSHIIPKYSIPQAPSASTRQCTALPQPQSQPATVPAATMPEVEHIPTNRSLKEGRDHSMCKQRSLTNRVFQSFRSSRVSSGIVKRSFHRKHLDANPRRVKCLYESFRLDEKYRYMELLKSQTITEELLAPFKVKSVLGAETKAKSIPMIDLTKEKNTVRVQRHLEVAPTTRTTTNATQNDDEVVILKEKTSPGRINTLQDCLRTYPVTADNLVQDILDKHRVEREKMGRQASKEEALVEALRETNKVTLDQFLEKRLQKYMKITEQPIEEVEEEAYILPVLTEAEEGKVAAALRPQPQGQVLVTKFGLEITRRDMQTLQGLHWLNDEVINFYMNLVMERAKNNELPKVYAFNTFFYPKLTTGGHQSLKRWTKKVDIFAHDLILVPIHLGMHWCMSVIDFRNKEVRFYDSMGTPNNRCLHALLGYLQAESLDKKKVVFSTQDWTELNVEGIPQQMNGSDCGVFSCMFAEHIARDCPLLFSQEQMPYFRKKMVLEILEGKLIT